MQIQVHHVNAEIAGPRDAHQRIHVGAVHVDQRALVVQNVAQIFAMFSSNTPTRVRIRHHQAGNIVRDALLERFQIDHAAVVRFDVLDRVADHRRRGRIGAVRGIGHQDLLARIAARFEQRADQQDAREFAVRAGRRLQRDGVHPGDFSQRRSSAAITSMQPCDNASG